MKSYRVKIKGKTPYMQHRSQRQKESGGDFGMLGDNWQKLDNLFLKLMFCSLILVGAMTLDVAVNIPWQGVGVYLTWQGIIMLGIGAYLLGRIWE